MAQSCQSEPGQQRGNLLVDGAPSASPNGEAFGQLGVDEHPSTPAVEFRLAHPALDRGRHAGAGQHRVEIGHRRGDKDAGM